VLYEVRDGTVRWTEQEGPSSYAQKLSVADSWVDFGEGAKHAHNQVRALSPTVGARALFGQTEVKIWRTWPYGDDGLDEVPPAAAVASGHAGRIVACQGRLFAGCTKGVIEILELQPASRARMDATAFLRGYSACLTAEVRGVNRSS
jgi:methionyl-tRNA formyltransferase